MSMRALRIHTLCGVTNAVYQGKLSCGAVHYSSYAETALTAFCHCRNCQKAGGGGYSVNVAVPASSLQVQGITKSYEGLGTSGLPAIRRFCPQCGSALFTDAVAFAATTFVKAGSLDDSSWIQPTLQFGATLRSRGTSCPRVLPASERTRQVVVLTTEARRGIAPTSCGQDLPSSADLRWHGSGRCARGSQGSFAIWPTLARALTSPFMYIQCPCTQ